MFRIGSTVVMRDHEKFPGEEAKVHGIRQITGEDYVLYLEFTDPGIHQLARMNGFMPSEQPYHSMGLCACRSYRLIEKDVE